MLRGLSLMIRMVRRYVGTRGILNSVTTNHRLIEIIEIHVASSYIGEDNF